MKFQFSYLILLCYFSVSFRPSNPSKFLNNNDYCPTIIDSAEALLQTSEFAINTQPKIKDSERNLRLDKWLLKLSFENLTCLLDSKNISIIAIGFMYAVNSHRDSLLKKYSHLLTDTTAVQLFMADGRKSHKVKFGEFLSAMTQKIREDNDNFARRPEIEEIISTFIRKYSTYPNTYKPISFPYFSMGSDDKGLRDYKIHHDYEIKNNEGMNVRVVSAFVLDKNLRINIIEKDSTTYSFSYPPKLGYWLEEFGRKLTRSDSLTLTLR